MLPWAHPLSVKNGIIAAFAHQTAESCYTLQRAATFHLIIAPPTGDLNHPLTHGSLYPPKSSTQTATWLVQPFLHSSPQTLPILYNGPPLLPQNCPFTWRSGPHLIHDSLHQPESSTQVASGLVKPFLQGSLLRQTDWQTTLSVGNNRLHLCRKYGDVA